MKKSLIRLLSIVVLALIAFASFCYHKWPDNIPFLDRLEQGFSNIIENRHCEGADGKPCQIANLSQQQEQAEENRDSELSLSAKSEIRTGVNIPPCTSELKNITAISISNTAKNCTYKEKEWIIPEYPDGLIIPPIYIINNSLAGFGPYIISDITSPNIICATESNYGTLYALRIERNYEGNNEYLKELSDTTYDKIVGKGLINQICTDKNGQNQEVIYCPSEDTDCWSMQNGGVRNDGTNYFIAGYRLPMDNIQRKSDYLYFVINDKLYEASNRNFAGIENGKIIVKRMLDIDEDRDTWKASFTLETCEIDL